MREAEETLETLKNFNDRVKESKAKADEALRKVGDIEKTIEEAKSVTNAVDADLVDAGEDAEAAAADAADAADIAFRSGRDAMALADEMETTAERAQDAGRKADVLARAVNVTEEKLKLIEDTTRDDAARAEEALQTAGAAERMAKAASGKSGDVLADLERLLRDLENVEVVDAESLRRLLRELEATEKSVRDMDLDAKISQMEIGARQHRTIIEEFEREAHELEEQVVNVEEIRRALPERCSNYVSIENEPSRRARARGRARRKGSDDES